MAKKLEKYAEIEELIKKTAEDTARRVYAEEATKYGVAKTPLHRHNGADSPRIKAQDIEASLSTSGNITMSTDGQRYSIGLNTKPGYGFTPSVVRFNGIVVSPSTAAPTIRALVQGDAFLGTSFYLQPESSTAVTIGGPGQAVIQSSAYILVNNSGAGPLTQALTSEGHIISVQFNGVIVARATIPDFGTYGATDGPIQNGVLLVDVELEPNWHIIGNFVIN